MQRTRAVAIFVIVTLLLVITALFLVFSMEKIPLHAWMNTHHSALGDLLFPYITHLADGWVPALLAIALLFYKDIRSFLMMGLSVAISAVICQVLKRMVFGEWDRPFMFKDELGDMSWVVGLELNHHFSFPSGHATTAFSMCFALVVVAGRAKWAAPLALIAAILAFSRVYLSQHFVEDITAGALLGTGISALVYLLMYKGPRSADIRLDRRMLKRPTRSDRSAQSPA